MFNKTIAPRIRRFRGGALFKNIEHGAITARDDYDFGGTRHLMEFKNNIVSTAFSEPYMLSCTDCGHSTVTHTLLMLTNVRSRS